MTHPIDKHGTHHFIYCKNVEKLNEVIEPDQMWGPLYLRARCLGCGVLRHYIRRSDAA